MAPTVSHQPKVWSPSTASACPVIGTGTVPTIDPPDFATHRSSAPNLRLRAIHKPVSWPDRPPAFAQSGLRSAETHAGFSGQHHLFAVRAYRTD
jgi:hypothetical protein